MNRLTGIRMQAKMMPSQKNTIAKSSWVCTTRNGASPLLRRSAPTPKPITVMPVAMPLWSGNHLDAVATGVT